MAHLDEAQKRRLQPSTHQDKMLRLCPSVPASDTCDVTWHSAWYIAKAVLTTISCHFMCSSDWHFVSWSQPIRLKMPSSGVGWGDIRDFPSSALDHFIITLIQAEDTTMPFLLTYSCKDWQRGSEIWFHHLSKPSTPGGSSRTILFRFLEVYLHTSQVENKTRSQEQQESGVWLSVPFSYVFLSHRVPFAEKQLDRVVSGARPYLEACFCGAKGIDTSFFLPQRKQKLIILTEEVQKFLGGD